MLAERGAELIDADGVVHEVEGPGTLETAAIAARFGEGILAEDGSVNRSLLGRIALDDAIALADLEAIVRPVVRRRIQDRLDQSTNEVVVIEALKLREGPLAKQVDSLWVVVAPAECRLERLTTQRGLSAADANRRMAAQATESEQTAGADVVIVNDGSLERLAEEVARAWEGVMNGLAPRSTPRGERS